MLRGELVRSLYERLIEAAWFERIERGELAEKGVDHELPASARYLVSNGS